MGEFTNFCKRYYELLQQWNELENRFEELLENAIPYTGQTDAAELDAIIRCNRRIQKARAAADECINDLQQIAHIITKILEYFEVPPYTRLTCEVPGFYELELWLDDEQAVNCIKTHDLAPLEEDENTITIHCIDTRNNWEEDEDDD